MSDTVYYLGYFDTPKNEAEKRYCVLSASNKMSYIASAICSVGYKVQIVSASETRLHKYLRGRNEPLSDGVSLRLPSSFWGSTHVSHAISRIYTKMQVFLYLLSIPAGSAMVVYHSLEYIRLVLLLRRMKRFKLILEVEEIYSDLIGKVKAGKREQKLFRQADGYIFSTQLLDEKINVAHKPFVVIHGTYQAEPEQMRREEYCALRGWDTHKCHIVYAGTFDSRKGGAAVAATAAAYLPDHYHLHLIGFGPSHDEKQIRTLVSQLEAQCACTITYDGRLSGNEYIRFIQSCDIGLCAQNPHAPFNASSFPSKILSYMANGLRVVCIRIPAIETSAIGAYMYYYDEPTSEKLAQTVMRVNLKDAYDGKSAIVELDRQFRTEIRQFLEKIR